MGICNTNALADKPKNDSDDKYETRFSFDGFEDNENGSGSSIEKSTQENTHNVLENTTPIAITHDFFTSPTTATTATTTTATTTTTTITTTTLTTITENTGLMGNNGTIVAFVIVIFIILSGVIVVKVLECRKRSS